MQTVGEYNLALRLKNVKRPSFEIRNPHLGQNRVWREGSIEVLLALNITSTSHRPPFLLINCSADKKSELPVERN